MLPMALLRPLQANLLSGVTREFLLSAVFEVCCYDCNHMPDLDLVVLNQQHKAFNQRIEALLSPEDGHFHLWQWGRCWN